MGNADCDAVPVSLAVVVIVAVCVKDDEGVWELVCVIVAEREIDGVKVMEEVPVCVDETVAELVPEAVSVLMADRETLVETVGE